VSQSVNRNRKARTRNARQRKERHLNRGSGGGGGGTAALTNQEMAGSVDYKTAPEQTMFVLHWFHLVTSRLSTSD